MTNRLTQEVAAFVEGEKARRAQARQMAALQIACHVDIAAAIAAPLAARRQIAARLERTIERERQRGMRNHWSYDLNRHIALKQALDTLRSTMARKGADERQRKRAPKRNGARRRRQEYIT